MLFNSNVISETPYSNIININGTVSYETNTNNGNIIIDNSSNRIASNYLSFQTILSPTYTLCFKVYFDTLVSSRNYSLLSICYFGLPTKLSIFFLYNSTSMKYMVYNNSSEFFTTRGSSYKHFAVVFNQYNSCTIYLDGVKVTPVTNNPNPRPWWVNNNPPGPTIDSVVTIDIGRGRNTENAQDSNFGFSGSISNFQLYNIPLTDSSINYLYSNENYYYNI